jgi:hypothetical protein
MVGPQLAYCLSAAIAIATISAHWTLPSASSPLTASVTAVGTSERASEPEGKRCMATASLCTALVAPMPHKTRRGIHVFTTTTTTITITTTPPAAVVVVVGVPRRYYTSSASRTVT